MNFSHLTKVTEKFLIDNSPAILTGIGATGVVVTAVLTAKSATKAERILQEALLQKALDDRTLTKSNLEPEELTGKEKVNLTWKLYIPPALVGAATIAAIIGANQIGTKRAAALAAAYTMSERAAAEFREKVAEKMGEKKYREVKEEIAQERIMANPPKDIIVIGTGEHKTLEMFTGRYFMCSYEELKKAQNDLNYRLNNDGYASLSDFYDLIGIPTTSESQEVGWTSRKLLELEITTVLSPKGEPCIAFDYNVVPVRDYFRFGR